MTVREALECQLETNRLIWLNNRLNKPETAEIALETINVVLDMYPNGIPREFGKIALLEFEVV